MLCCVVLVLLKMFNSKSMFLLSGPFKKKEDATPSYLGSKKPWSVFLRQIKENSWSQISFINFGANLLSCQTENNFYCLFKLGVLFGSAFHSIINKIYARSIKLYLRIKINSTCKPFVLRYDYFVRTIKTWMK